MLWKRRVSILMVWILVTVAGLAVVSRIPSIYKAEAVILVDSQKIPDRYVSSTVVSDARDRIATISQEILSSGRLEKIINDFDLYHRERQTHFREEILAMMRKDMETVPERTWAGRTASFRISYKGRDPNVVAQVTNKIASLYVEENLKARENQAEGTSEFLNAQLNEAKQKLDQLEAQVSQYKLRHNGELPEQEDTLNGILSRLQVALEANRDSINRAQQQKVMLQDSLDRAEATEQSIVRDLQAAASGVALPGSLTTAPAPRPRKKSEELESQLADLRLRYTDDHPDIRRLRALIPQAKQLEQREEAESASTATASSTTPAPRRPAPVLNSPDLIQARSRIASIQSQLTVTSKELETRKGEQQRILSDINLYQGRVNGVPIREQEMAGLTRDYEMSKTNYHSLLDKKISAEMAADMERRQKSERFTIVDPARLPSKPFKPNRPLFNIGASVFGLVLGLALALGREFKESTLLGEWELPSDVTILGRLPYIDVSAAVPSAAGPGGEGPTKKRSRKLALVSSAVLSLLGVLAAGFYLVSHRS